MNEKEELIMAVDVEIETYYHAYGILTVRIMRLEDGKIVRPTEGYALLTVRGQCNPFAKDEKPYFYGYRVHFANIDVVTENYAESMLRVLRMINRKMAKLADRFGYPQDLASYLLHLADVLGITEFYWPTEYSDRFPIKDLPGRIRSQLSKWEK